MEFSFFVSSALKNATSGMCHYVVRSKFADISMELFYKRRYSNEEIGDTRQSCASLSLSFTMEIDALLPYYETSVHSYPTTGRHIGEVSILHTQRYTFIYTVTRSCSTVDGMIEVESPKMTKSCIFRIEYMFQVDENTNLTFGIRNWLQYIDSFKGFRFK
jgi:hypothetical protein